MSKQSPRLRTVNKSAPAYPLNKFPKEFPYIIGKEIVYLLATKGKSNLIGSEWEEIFAKSIGANWKDSNVGLDDIKLGNTAWGAKTVKAKNPSKQKEVRLVSGRNSIVYSFGSKVDTSVDPNIPGEQVLSIWNDRVSAVRERYDHLRTIVLIKADDLSEVLVFEFETIRYDPELFYWQWNKSKNLEGFNKATKQHNFTWQPHGSQFTILESVPKDSLVIKIRRPEYLNKEKTLEVLGFNESWITVTKNND
jgi:hypothetical protein